MRTVSLLSFNVQRTSHVTLLEEPGATLASASVPEKAQGNCTSNVLSKLKSGSTRLSHGTFAAIDIFTLFFK